MKNKDVLRERYEQIREVVRSLCESETLGCIGRSSTDNTPNQIDELAFALSLSQHPEIERMLSDPELKDITYSPFSCEIPSKLDSLAKRLQESAVLNGKRILDLGCGYEPAFADCSRRLGADRVYTVDIVPSEKLWVRSDKQKEVVEDHIQLDLRDPNAYDILRERTGANFDLVASSSIHEMSEFADFAGRGAPPAYLNDLALALAKEDGIYFCAEYLQDPKIHLKDPSIDYEKRVRKAVKSRRR